MKGKMDKECGMHGIGRETLTAFWLENLKEQDQYDELDIGGRILLKWILKEWAWCLLSGFISLRIGVIYGCF